MTEGDDTWRTRDMKRSGEGRGGREWVRTGSGKKKSQAKCEVAKKQLNKKKKGEEPEQRQERLEKGCGAAAQMQDESYLFVES